MVDIRRDGYFGAVLISGVGGTKVHRGSIMAIVAESLKDITASRARPNSDGESEILIRIRNKPFDTSKEAGLQMEKAREVEDLLDSGPSTIDPDGSLEDTPGEHESYEQFYDRLVANDYPIATAEFLACQWFQREPSPETQAWLTDAKAIRFRLLNSNREAFQAALPAEYESLKHYVKTTYPTFVEHLTFRTA